MDEQVPQEAPRDQKGRPKGKGRGGSTRSSAKLRGLPKDDPEVRISKTLSWILRHGSESEGLAMRSDGYVRVTDLVSTYAEVSFCDHHSFTKRQLALPKMREVDFALLEQLVAKDNKNRYRLLSETNQAQDEASPQVVWWIRANQGHSLKVSYSFRIHNILVTYFFQSVELELQPINAVADIPTGVAVHGTNRKAWEIIRKTVFLLSLPN